MDLLKLLTFPEQLAVHLRGQILRGKWRGEMPGAPTLASEFGVDHRLIISAFSLLEKEGLLAPQGPGRRRKILLPENQTPPALRVEILFYEEDDRKQYFFADLQHQLLDLGHVAGFASKTLQDLGMDRKRIARFVQKTEADAWVVFSGSQEVLTWFSQQPKPAFALAGRRRRIPMAGAGPEKVPAQRDAVRRLISLGHRRIVMLAHEERRKPDPGFLERAFLQELETHGIQTGTYNLPDWKHNIVGFHQCLDSLFRHTPPTALIIDDMPLFIAAQLHLARSGLMAPRDVSLICTDPNPAFAWCQPSIAHIHWDARPIVRRIVRWADNVARGRDDRHQSNTKAEFIEGGTIGPAPGSV